MEQKIKQKEFKIGDFSDEELKNMSGVYQIRNVINNHFYIGSAVNFLKRKNEHFQQLRDLKHINSKLSDATVEFGLYNFVFEVIEVCEKNECLKIEQNWLNKYFGKPYFYNKNPFATKPPSKKTEEHKRKLSESKKGDKNPAKTMSTRKKMSETRKYKISIGELKPPMCNRKHTEESRKKMSKSRKGKYTGANNHRSKKVRCIEEDIIFNSLKEAGEWLGRKGRHCGDIIAVNLKKGKTECLGYHWEYVD